MRKTFDAYEVSALLVRTLRQAVVEIARRDSALADQLRRAATSVPLNVAEGNCRAGRDRQHHFRIARGSVAEVAACLRVAVDWAYVDETAVAEAIGLTDRIRAMLWRLTQ